MQLTDIFDKNKLQFIIDNFDYFSNMIGRFVDLKHGYEIITNKKTILSLLKKLLKNEPVNYTYSSKDISKKGRLFGSNSLQGISRVIRHTICKNECIDIDIVNAHNVFLQHYCMKNDIKFPYLEYYNQNRNELLIELMEIYDIDRDCAKKICLSIINGGGNEWFKKPWIAPPEWLILFQNEIKGIHKKIAKLEPERFEKSKIDNKDNPYGTCLNTILCEMENYVLGFMIEYCKLKNIKISTLCFDGILVAKCDIDVKEMNEFVKNHSKIDCQLVIKEMDEDIDLTVPSNFQKSDDEFVNPDIFYCSEKVNIVKAGLGTGKTTACISYINSNPTNYAKIAIFTPRITYANSIFDRLNKESIYNDWVLYNAKDTNFCIDNKHVVVQCESIYRLSNVFLEDTLIIIDEIETFLTSLTSTKTHAKNHENNLDTFEGLLNCKKVICLDAFITDKTFNIFKTLQLPYFYTYYTKKLKERQFIHIKADKDKDVFCQWMEYIINELSNGKRMYLFFSSLKKLDYFKNYVDINLPDINYLYYSSTHKESLNNVNELWSGVDLILTTGTITVGVNYDIKNHFHSIGIYVSATSKNLVRDIFQSSYRIRHLQDDLLIFGLDTAHYGLNLSTSINEIRNSLTNKIVLQIELYEKLHLQKHPNTTNYSWLKELFLNNIHEFNLSIMNLESEFYQYLDECNYVECDIMNNIENELLHDDELSKINYVYSDIPSVSVDTMKLLRKQPTKSILEQLVIEKFFFQQSIQEIDDKKEEECLWRIYTDYGRSKFRNIRHEKQLVNNILNLSVAIDSTLPIIADVLGIRLNTIKKISSWYGLDHSQDNAKIIPYDKLKKLIPLFQENIKEIYTAFDLRETRSKKDEWTVRKITTITNMVLSKWGYTKLKKKSPLKRKGKKQDYISDYIVENTEEINVYNYVK